MLLAAEATCALVNRVPVVWTVPHHNSHPLSSRCLLGLRLPPGPPNASALTLLAVVSEALCFLDALAPCVSVPALYFCRLCSVPGPFSFAVPRGLALHRFVWRLAAGWHIVPRVLIRCQLLSIFTSPPRLTLSACVTACLHPPSAERTYKKIIQLLS